MTTSRDASWIAVIALSCASSPSSPNTPPPPTTVLLVPVFGAPDRATVIENRVGGPDFVEGPALVSALGRVEKSIGRFVEQRTRPAHDRMIDHFTDFDVRGRDLRQIVRRTMDAIPVGDGAPRILFGESSMGFPSVHVVWQYPGLHKALVIGQGNDNVHVRLEVGPGAFSVERLRLRQVTEAPAGSDPLAFAPFLLDSSTIYPHIEAYYLCDPVCEGG